MTAYDRLSTAALRRLRDRLVASLEDVGADVVAGRVRAEEVKVSVQLRAAQVEAMDASLLRRGEPVPEPFWL